jgi:hypothetical protein
MISMLIVFGLFLDKRPWSEPGTIETAVGFSVVGAGLGLVISRLTRRHKSR